MCFDPRKVNVTMMINSVRYFLPCKIIANIEAALKKRNRMAGGAKVFPRID